MAAGIGASATGTRSIAIGDSIASGDQAIALGNSAEVTAANGLALGNNTAANAQAGDVALGSGSTTSTVVKTATGEVNGTTYAYAGGDPASTVSVGSAGHERTITNVAAGRVTEDSTDAINGSQLYATNSAISDLSDTVDANKTHYYSVDDGGTQGSNFDNDGATGNGAIAAGKGATAHGTGAIALGLDAKADSSTASIINGDDPGAGDGPAIAIGNQSQAVKDGTALGFQTQATGRASTVVGSRSTATHENAVAVGYKDNATAQEATAIGSYNEAGALGATVLGSHNQATGIASTAIGNYAVAGGLASTAIGGHANASGTNAIALGTAAAAPEANSVALGAGSITAAANPFASSEISGTTYTYAGGAPTSVVSVGAAGQERQVTHVAAGRISSTSTDAINGSQFYALQQAFQEMHWDVEAPAPDGSGSSGSGSGGSGSGSTGSGDTPTPIYNGNTVGFVAGDNIAISKTDRVDSAGNTVGTNVTIGLAQDVTVQSLTSKTVTANTVSIVNGPTIDQNGIDMHDQHITHLADGVNDQDAVNVRQLNKATGDLNNRVNQLDNKIDHVDNRASAGIAAALATASLPQAYLPGKSMLSIAGGAWRGESGYAIGLSTVSDNGSWVVKGSATSSSRGDYGGSVGVGYQW